MVGVWCKRACYDLRPQRVWTLRKDGHEAVIDLKAVPGVDAAIVLTVRW
jgi:hypothetical protein